MLVVVSRLGSKVGKTVPQPIRQRKHNEKDKVKENNVLESIYYRRNVSVDQIIV